MRVQFLNHDFIGLKDFLIKFIAIQGLFQNHNKNVQNVSSIDLNLIEVGHRT